MRTRRSNPLDLPAHTHFKHGKFWYVHPESHRWENLGTDLITAREEGRRRNGNAPGVLKHSVEYYSTRFLAQCALRVQAKKLAPRTASDYKASATIINTAFGRMHPTTVKPEHISAWLEKGEADGRAVRANRDRAYFSAMFSWMLRTGECPGLQRNPCLRQYGVTRNRETKRTRYVTDAEYQAIQQRATQPVRDAMDMAYYTLQRPADLLRLKRTCVNAEGDQRLLTLTQSKTGLTISIQLTGDLGALVQRLNAAAGLRTIIHNRRGQPYNDNSISGMIRKHCKAASIPSFGLQDLKSKGATDMHLHGIPLEQIQQLCGHKSITTTEIYVKRHAPHIAAPNAIRAPATQSR